MKRQEIKDKCEQILNHYGPNHQIDMMIEEMAELTHALCKAKRDESDINSIREELADVLVMSTQMLIMFDYTEEIEQKMLKKLDRQLTRITLDRYLEAINR